MSAERSAKRRRQKDSRERRKQALAGKRGELAVIAAAKALTDHDIEALREYVGRRERKMAGVGRPTRRRPWAPTTTPCP